MQGDGKTADMLALVGFTGNGMLLWLQTGFSEHLVKQRGIYAQVIPFTKDDGTTACRHLHPCELSLLNAMPPPHQWFLPEHPDLRLCLGAIGQLASPLQAVWVGACVVSKFHQVLDLPAICPKSLLHAFRSRMFMCAKDMYPSIMGPPVNSLPAEPSWVSVTHPDGTSVHIQVGHDTTFAELCQAELALTQQDLAGSWCDADSGLPFEANDRIAGKCIRVISEVSSHVASTVESVPEHMQVDLPNEAKEPQTPSPSAVWVRKSPCPDGSMIVSSGSVPDMMLGLSHLTGGQLAALLPPLVTDVAYCDVLRQSLVHGPARLKTLANEGQAMADDELTLHLRASLRLAGREDVQLLDPLLALGWMSAGDIDKARAWISQFPVCPRLCQRCLSMNIGFLSCGLLAFPMPKSPFGNTPTLMWIVSVAWLDQRGLGSSYVQCCLHTSHLWSKLLWCCCGCVLGVQAVVQRSTPHR